mmetsp:Transcript_57620/g.132932  ORF Transcript_57620/g.132932 Transcript_57620/m.132932 type:complete len:84 (+) Transcript_57620:44-295(+)
MERLLSLLVEDLVYALRSPVNSGCMGPKLSSWEEGKSSLMMRWKCLPPKVLIALLFVVMSDQKKVQKKQWKKLSDDMASLTFY